MHSIKIQNLSKTYEKLKAVDNLNLEVKEGEVFGLLGPNGAGKSTTIKMLITLIKPSGGKGFVNGFDISKQPSDVRKSIGVVFQEPSVDDLLTGRENLRLHGLMYGIPRNRIEPRIDEVLKLVDLEKRADDQVKKYSGGMRRRLEIARGLMHIPKVLFLDEPTLGLDPQSRQHIWKYIQSLAKARKMTIFLTTHYMEEAEAICDRIAIIDHGRVVVLDTPTKLKAKLGGDVIRIKTRNPNMAKLKGLKYIRKIEHVNGEVQITAKDASSHLKEILNYAGDVKSVEVREPTLNDVFLHYTGHEIREEEGQSDWSTAGMMAEAKRD